MSGTQQTDIQTKINIFQSVYFKPNTEITTKRYPDQL